MQTQPLTFVNRSGRQASGLRALFPPSRTSLLGYRLDPLPHGVTAIEVGVNTRAADLRWDPPIHPGEAVTLLVDYLGEPLQVEECAWRDANGPLCTDGQPVTPGLVLLLGAGSIEEIAVRAREFDHQRCRVVAGVADPAFQAFRAFHAFFCEYDDATNPGLMVGMPVLEKDRWTTMIQHMGLVLRRRVLLRAAWAKDHDTEPPDLPRSETTQVEQISDLQLQIFRRHFGKTDGTIDLERFWEAFERFANGELQVKVTEARWKHWDAAPRSALAFSFAEFAFMAQDLGIADAESWVPLMRPFVAIQEVYTAAYRPRTGNPEEFSFDDYQPDNWADDQYVMTQQRKDALRQRYTGLTPEALRLQAGRNALDAFPAGG